ncbi:MAG: flavin reductase family protein [Actinomycetota bacterium]|nr:flavin reductase family protein [Actinomycetota bacterium]
MPISPDELKEVMSLVAATVTVVTADSDDGPVGLTVSSFMSVSADPAIVLVCVAKTTTSQQSMVGAEGFTVNVMPQGTEDEAMLFAKRGADRFGSSRWSDPGTPAAGPVLESAMAHLECVTIDRTEVGDHWVIYGEVLVTKIANRDLVPLVWRGRGFVKIQE